MCIRDRLISGPSSFFVRLVFRLVVFPYVSCIAFFDFLSLPCLPWWRILLLFCYFASSLFHNPLRSLRAWSMRTPLACCLFVAFLMQIYLFFSSLPLFFSISIRTYRLLHPVYFLWILCCLGFGFWRDSLSIRMMRILIRGYADYTLLFFVWGIRFVSVIASIILCSFVFLMRSS